MKKPSRKRRKPFGKVVGVERSRRDQFGFNYVRFEMILDVPRPGNYRIMVQEVLKK